MLQEQCQHNNALESSTQLPRRLSAVLPLQSGQSFNLILCMLAKTLGNIFY